MLTKNGKVTEVALVDGREIATSTVVTAVHPQIGFLRHLDASQLPDDFVADIRRWRSRSGTVKVNVARSPEEAEMQASGVDVMAAMFEKDDAGFVEDFDPNAEPGATADVRVVADAPEAAEDNSEA